jgi:hypothetical protein
MKIEKKSLVILGFIIALVIFLLIIFINTGFNPDFKDIITAFYFAIWVAAVLGICAFFIYPYIREKKKQKQKKVPQSESKKDEFVASPHPDLPLRDRIRLYVTERREAEGLFVPEPLVISKVAPVLNVFSPANISYSGIKTSEAPVKVPDASDIIAKHDVEDSDLPFPDDFDQSGDEDIFSLPDIDDEEKSIPQKKKEEDIESESLPEFDGDLGSYESDSDLNDSIMDLSDVVEEPEEDSQDTLPDLEEGESGDELPDIDEIELDEDMMDSDFSGDDDLSDMEFEDLEPDDK